METEGKTRIVAITGGIASGKSTVGEIIANTGYMVIDLDQIAWELTVKGSPVLEEIIRQFGDEVISDDGGLNRKTMAKIVFNDPEKRRQLENIIHPEISKAWQQRAEKSGEKWVFVLIPLLFEANLQDTVDRIWLCHAPEELRLNRAMIRDGASEASVRLRISAQLSDDEKINRSDIVLDTSKSREELERQVRSALAELN